MLLTGVVSACTSAGDAAKKLQKNVAASENGGVLKFETAGRPEKPIARTT
jgi:hypothetical protein